MKTVLFITLAGFCSLQSVRAQSNFNLTVDHLAISVKDVNRAAEFYGGILKFEEIKNRSAYEGVRWFSIGQGKELHLISMLKDEVTLSKAIHIAFTTPDFEAFVAMLDKMKIPYSDWPGAPNKIHLRADGMKQIFFQDPDGNWIEINSVAQK